MMIGKDDLSLWIQNHNERRYCIDHFRIKRRRLEDTGLKFKFVTWQAFSGRELCFGGGFDRLRCLAECGTV